MMQDIEDLDVSEAHQTYEVLAVVGPEHQARLASIDAQFANLNVTVRSHEDYTEALASTHVVLYECRVMEGMEELAHIAQLRQSNSYLPIVCFSRNDSIDFREACFQSGATDYLTQNSEDNAIGWRLHSQGYLGSSARLLTIQSAELIKSMRELRAKHEALIKEMTLREELEQEREESHLQAMQSEKMACLGEMASSIIHEINNPLSIVMGKTYKINKCMASEPLDKDGVLKSVESIVNAAKRMDKIVSGLGAFARADQREQKVTTCVRTIFEETLPFCAGRLKKKHVALEVTALPEGLFIDCHPTEISQVFVNLINNASDAIQDFPKTERWVKVNGEVDGDTVRIKVTDCGAGIPEEKAAKIFDSFYTTKEPGKGTGLGLNIVRKSISRHQGRIFIDQDCPHTCFVIELPLSQKRPALQGQAS